MAGRRHECQPKSKQAEYYVTVAHKGPDWNPTVAMVSDVQTR